MDSEGSPVFESVACDGVDCVARQKIRDKNNAKAEAKAESLAEKEFAAHMAAPKSADSK